MARLRRPGRGGLGLLVDSLARWPKPRSPPWPCGLCGGGLARKGAPIERSLAWDCWPSSGTLFLGLSLCWQRHGISCRTAPPGRPAAHLWPDLVTALLAPDDWFITAACSADAQGRDLEEADLMNLNRCQAGAAALQRRRSAMSWRIRWSGAPWAGVGPCCWRGCAPRPPPGPGAGVLEPRYSHRSSTPTSLVIARLGSAPSRNQKGALTDLPWGSVERKLLGGGVRPNGTDVVQPQPPVSPAPGQQGDCWHWIHCLPTWPAGAHLFLCTDLGSRPEIEGSRSASPGISPPRINSWPNNDLLRRAGYSAPPVLA